MRSGAPIIRRRGSDRVERLLDAAGMRPPGFGECVEPVGDLVEALLAGALGHAGIHVGVFVRFTGDRRLQIQRCRADGQTRRRIAARLQELEMAVGMARLAFGSRAEHCRDVVITLDVRLLCEIKIAAICL